jgi:hypothetical protein
MNSLSTNRFGKIMEQENAFNVEISKIINKIKRDWERAIAGDDKISKIDKDILITDLKIAYELVSDLQVKSLYSGYVKTAASNNPVHETKNNPATISEETGEVKIENKPTTAASPKPNESPESKTKEENNAFAEKQNLKESPQKSSATQVKNKDDNMASTVTVKKNLNVEAENESRKTLMTGDLFSPPKSVSDIFNDNGNNTLASKFEKNKITDIKSAIGINDKFTFINDIFKGEIAAYNNAVEHLNTLDSYQEALAYIRESGLATGTEENKQALAKFTELLKRKF